jgi:hypothetical protein
MPSRAKTTIRNLGFQAQTAELSGMSASAAAADSIMLSCWLRNSLDVYLMAITRAVVIAGKPRAPQIAWENRGKVNRSRRVRANPAGIWMTWRRAAFKPPLTPLSVVCGRPRQPR